ncbi:hypothetical protein [Prauserella flavalba]|uniref:hypothetical protein n=1 Tax=Prauserella flavalba TaxID=1477506 RepID=UPI0036F08712
MGALHRRTGPAPRRGRDAARTFLTRSPGVPAELPAYVFGGGFYARLADRLLGNLPWYRRVLRGHRLCTLLDAQAAKLDPAAYAMLAQTPVRDALRGLGFPPFLAGTLGEDTALGARCILGGVHRADLGATLRVLIALVCPELGACPTCLAVHTTFASPGLLRRLRVLAGYDRQLSRSRTGRTRNGR